jgi:hypothetical protein
VSVRNVIADAVDRPGFDQRSPLTSADAIIAALRTAGYVVAPREPTIDMEVAATEAWLCVAAMEDRAAVIYRAMLSAAEGDAT